MSFDCELVTTNLNSKNNSKNFFRIMVSEL